MSARPKLSQRARVKWIAAGALIMSAATWVTAWLVWGTGLPEWTQIPLLVHGIVCIAIGFIVLRVGVRG